MTWYGKSSWSAALVLGLIGLMGVGAATVPAAPARSAASAFELTLEETVTFDGEVVIGHATFRSRAPFCTTGTVGGPIRSRTGKTIRQFTCDDGTGSLTVSMGQAPPTWRILDGSGSYAGLRGMGSVREEQAQPDAGTWTVRQTFEGAVDRDTVAPTIKLLNAAATKLRRPAGAYALRFRIALRDNRADNPVSYTVRVSGPHGRELARSFGTATTGTVSTMLRVRPLAGARFVRLELTAEDPVGNQVSVWPRDLRLPR